MVAREASFIYVQHAFRARHEAGAFPYLRTLSSTEMSASLKLPPNTIPGIDMVVALAMKRPPKAPDRA